MTAFSDAPCYGGKQRNSRSKWTIYYLKYTRKTYKCIIFEEGVHHESHDHVYVKLGVTENGRGYSVFDCYSESLSLSRCMHVQAFVLAFIGTANLDSKLFSSSERIEFEDSANH